MNSDLASPVENTGTLLICCPSCGSDIGETEGLTGPMDRSSDGVVIMSCGECSSIYLSPPRNDLGKSPPPLAINILSGGRIRRWARDLPLKAKVLYLDSANGSHLEAIARVGGSDWVITGSECGTSKFDLIILPHSLESVRNPDEFLRQMTSQLAEGGRVIVIVSNIDSSVFGMFGGRHWCGYEFPNTRQHFNAHSLRRLCGSAGLEICEMTTLPVSNCWLASIRNLLRDWGAAEGWIGIATGRWLVPQVLASVFETIAQLRGRGSLLIVELEKD